VPIPVAARFNGHTLAGTAGSNSAGSMDASLLRVLCVISASG